MQEKYQAITNEQQFLEVMEQVDAELQIEQVPIHARSIQAILKVGKRVGEGLIISPLPKTPEENVYSGSSLSTRISGWYKHRYGDRMKVDPCSYTAVLVREDVYRMRLPYFGGSLELICRPDLMGLELGPSMRTDGKPVVVNVLDSIQGLTQNYAESFVMKNYVSWLAGTLWRCMPLS